MKKVKTSILCAFLMWLFLSVLGSMFKASPHFDNCDNSYPVDYVIYTGLFCEIKKD